MSTERDTELSRGFDAGNYANAYETTDYDRAVSSLSMNRSEAYVAAFTLGFFGSYELDEMGEHADTYLEALRGPHGKRAAEIGIAVPSEQDFDGHNFGEAAW